MPDSRDLTATILDALEKRHEGNEIKVSRADFLAEIKRKPLKRRAGLRLSNESYFVAPKGIIEIDELPPEAGLLE